MIEIAHSVPGRLRIRVPSILQDRREANAVRQAVLSIPGVREVLPNGTTGSVVVTYDTAELCPASLWRELNTRVAACTAPADFPRDRRDSEPNWADMALKALFDSLVGAVVERSAIAVVRAIL